MQLDPVVCVESVWYSTIRHISATPPPPIKVIFHAHAFLGLPPIIPARDEQSETACPEGGEAINPRELRHFG